MEIFFDDKIFFVEKNKPSLRMDFESTTIAMVFSNMITYCMKPTTDPKAQVVKLNNGKRTQFLSFGVELNGQT